MFSPPCLLFSEQAAAELLVFEGAGCRFEATPEEAAAVLARFKI